MKEFITYDLQDNILGTSQTQFEAERCFLECYPSFDKNSVYHFIEEREYFFTSCQSSQYEGLLTYQSWNLGKIQRRYCTAISIARRTMHPYKLLGAIIGTFKLSV